MDARRSLTTLHAAILVAACGQAPIAGTDTARTCLLSLPFASARPLQDVSELTYESIDDTCFALTTNQTGALALRLEVESRASPGWVHSLESGGNREPIAFPGPGLPLAQGSTAADRAFKYRDSAANGWLLPWNDDAPTTMTLRVRLPADSGPELYPSRATIKLTAADAM